MAVDIESLQDEMKFHFRAAKEIADKVDAEARSFTDDEIATVEEHRSEGRRIKADVDKLLDTEKRQRAIREELDEINTPQRRSKPIDVESATSDSTDSKPRIEFAPRYGKLRAFKGKDAEARAYASGQWIRANIFQDTRAKRWCRDNGMDVETRALSEGVNSAGGFLVPNEMSQAIIDNREMYGIARQELRVVPMGRDTMTIPRRAGGVIAYFVGEGDSITESDKSWGNVTLTAKKLGVLTRMSSELADDAIINLADDIAGEIAYAFSEKEDDCLFNGDGTSTYGGIYGVLNQFEDNTGWAGYVNATTSGADTYAEVAAVDLAGVMGKLPQYAHSTAKWYTSQAGFDVMFSRLAISAGGNTVDSVTGEYSPSYLGYPIVVSQKMETSTGSLDNKVLCLFGDLSKAATLGDRREVSISLSDHRYFESDQVGIRGTERFDINVHDLGDNTTAGPVVALIGQA